MDQIAPLAPDPTAETHRAAVMKKLELDGLAALVRYAIRNNIVSA